MNQNNKNMKTIFNLSTLILGIIFMQITIFEIIVLRMFNMTGVAIIGIELFILLVPYNMVRAYFANRIGNVQPNRTISY